MTTSADMTADTRFTIVRVLHSHWWSLCPFSMIVDGLDLPKFPNRRTQRHNLLLGADIFYRVRFDFL